MSNCITSRATFCHKKAAIKMSGTKHQSVKSPGAKNPGTKHPDINVLAQKSRHKNPSTNRDELYVSFTKKNSQLNKYIYIYISRSKSPSKKCSGSWRDICATWELVEEKLKRACWPLTFFEFSSAVVGLCQPAVLCWELWLAKVQLLRY